MIHHIQGMRIYLRLLHFFIIQNQIFRKRQIYKNLFTNLSISICVYSISMIFQFDLHRSYPNEIVIECIILH